MRRNLSKTSLNAVEKSKNFILYGTLHLKHREASDPQDERHRLEMACDESNSLTNASNYKALFCSDWLQIALQSTKESWSL